MKLIGAPAPRLRVVGLRNAHVGPFDFALAPGACLAVTGSYGAGKSLMLRMIADLDPHDGDALLDGRPCTGMPASLWRRQVIYAAAESGWWLDRVGDHFHTPPVELVTCLALRRDILDRSVPACSTGERQRLALLRALEPQSPVLLLDEPTGALDVDGVARAEVLLRERLRAGVAMVLVTHDPAQAERLGTMHGKLEKDGCRW